MLADGGLAETAPFRGRGEAERFGDREEGAEEDRIERVFVGHGVSLGMASAGDAF